MAFACALRRSCRHGRQRNLCLKAHLALLYMVRSGGGGLVDGHSGMWLGNVIFPLSKTCFILSTKPRNRNRIRQARVLQISDKLLFRRYFEEGLGCHIIFLREPGFNICLNVSELRKIVVGVCKGLFAVQKNVIIWDLASVKTICGELDLVFQLLRFAWS